MEHRDAQVSTPTIFSWDTASVSTSEKLFALFSSGRNGLSLPDRTQRIKTYGPNTLETKEVTAFSIFIRQCNSPFLWLLIVAALVSFGVGEMIDGGLIMLFVCINTTLGFFQEYQSEKALALLKSFVTSRAHVFIDSEEVIIPGATLVPGDVIKVETGDIILADAFLLGAENLSIDEGMLTGESVAINKQAGTLTEQPTGIHEAKNLIFAGTKVTAGCGTALVYATGVHTQMGDIAKLSTETIRDGLLEKGVRRFSNFIIKMVVVVLVIVFVANTLINHGTSTIELLLFSIALAVSVIPEALPVVITLALTRGAISLAREHAVAKRLSAVEDIGSINVLCTDKTGTLTENTLSVANSTIAPDITSDELFIKAILSSSVIGNKGADATNAFDIALWNGVNDSIRAKVGMEWTRLYEIPFDPDRRRSSVLVESHKGTFLVVRGASDAIIENTDCSSHEKEMYHTWVAQEGESGHRVIAIAQKTTTLTGSYTVADETGLTLLGFVSFVDPIKATAKDAVAKAVAYGVMVKIITGDAPEVAGAVARDVGLISDPHQVLTGAAFEALSTDEKKRAVQEYHVFARVSPEQKFEIIGVLKEHFRVGFLGEGINDAPALKSAHIGLVVDNASDIARDAADIILLQHDLATIIHAIQNGRSILLNTVKYLKTTLISNFGNFYTLSIVSLITSALPMLPIQLLFLNLLTDFPAIALAGDANDSRELSVPRSYDIHEIILISIILGLVSTIFDFIMFAVFRHTPIAVLRTSWFIGSVLTEVILIYSIRTKRSIFKASFPSPSLMMLTSIAAIIACVIPFTTIGETLFHFVSPSGASIVKILIIVGLYFVVTEIIKNLYYRYRHLLLTSSAA